MLTKTGEAHDEPFGGRATPEVVVTPKMIAESAMGGPLDAKYDEAMRAEYLYLEKCKAFEVGAQASDGDTAFLAVQVGTEYGGWARLAEAERQAWEGVG